MYRYCESKKNTCYRCNFSGKNWRKLHNVVYYNEQRARLVDCKTVFNEYYTVLIVRILFKIIIKQKFELYFMNIYFDWIKIALSLWAFPLNPRDRFLWPYSEKKSSTVLIRTLGYYNGLCRRVYKRARARVNGRSTNDFLLSPRRHTHKSIIDECD